MAKKEIKANKTILIEPKVTGIRARVQSIERVLKSIVSIAGGQGMMINLEELIADRGKKLRSEFKASLSRTIPVDDFEIPEKMINDLRRQSYEKLANLDGKLRILKHNLYSIRIDGFFSLKDDEVVRNEEAIEKYIELTCNHLLTDTEQKLYDCLELLVELRKEDIFAENYSHTGFGYGNGIASYLNQIYGRTFL